MDRAKANWKGTGNMACRMSRKEQRKYDAIDRALAKRKPQDQIKHLNQMGYHAKKERAQLSQLK